jgi:hypothetical protein
MIVALQPVTLCTVKFSPTCLNEIMVCKYKMALEYAMCAGISVPLDCWFGHYKKGHLAKDKVGFPL